MKCPRETFNAGNFERNRFKCEIDVVDIKFKFCSLKKFFDSTVSINCLIILLCNCKQASLSTTWKLT